MSTYDPSEPSAGPEYLGDASRQEDEKRPRRRWGTIAVATAGVAAVVAVGGWGALTLMGGGTQPAEVIPAQAVGYVAVDLDPSASQKIEALRMLKKFPAIDEELDISDRGDLRRWLFEQAQEDGQCQGLEYSRDIEPWLGHRAAVAVMPQPPEADEPPILFALQVTDEEAAEQGIDALAACDQGQDSDEFGYTFADGYLLVSQDEAQAKSLAQQAARSPLSADPDFLSWTERAGEPGVLTVYAAAGAADAWMDAVTAEEKAGIGPSDPGDGEADLRRRTAAMFEGFEGMAATVRFDNGALELSWAGRGIPSGLPPTSQGTSAPILDLPQSTAVALSVALPDGWLERYLDQLSGMLGGMPGAPATEDLVRALEARSGLNLPQDVETLLGDNLTLAVDSKIDPADLTGPEKPTDVPVGIKLQGDPDEIMPIATRVVDRLDPGRRLLSLEDGDGEVALALGPDYAATLLEDGGLGGLVSFQQVVPDAEAASSVLFVNFDAGGDWLESWVATANDLSNELGDGPPASDDEALANVRPLDALGVSSWVDDNGVEHGLVKLTTD